MSKDLCVFRKTAVAIRLKLHAILVLEHLLQQKSAAYSGYRTRMRDIGIPYFVLLYVVICCTDTRLSVFEINAKALLTRTATISH